MPLTPILAGLACGALLAATGSALWDAFRPAPRLSLSGRIIRWLAGVLLLAGALLAWWEGYDFSGSTPRLILMAALAAPPSIRSLRRSPRDSVLRILPALLLAGAGLFWLSRTAPNQTSSLPVAPLALAVTICSGLGSRALGHALCEIASVNQQTEEEETSGTAEEPNTAEGPALSETEGPALSETEGPSPSGIEVSSAITYVLLSLIVGSAALVHLWQRGTLWGATASESGLAGTWLAWSAARLGPRRPPRLRATLVAVAALSLILAALR
jgi:hypothetical protein